MQADKMMLNDWIGCVTLFVVNSIKSTVSYFAG